MTSPMTGCCHELLILFCGLLVYTASWAIRSSVKDRPHAPGTVADPAFTEIDIEPDREKAKEKASARQKAAGVSVFSDASGQQNHLGAAAVALNPGGDIIQSRRISVGSMEYWSLYAAELMAIYYAISLVYQISQKKQEAPGTSREPATILTDSISELQAIANSWNKSGQRIIQAILKSARELNTRGVPLRLQWVPGHCEDLGNDTAGRLAKEAVGPDKMHPFQHLLSREKGFIRRKIREEWEQEWKASKKAGHLHQIKELSLALSRS
ncbi:hypothetical protein CNMCM7691_004063 [Aspergillus felis]|uniref:RNase H type-1 domain-containing protein n=1 Tax=Aspergillus felis TaxID=1287682 RepID=A0A8H6R325_9EURO|nr:hypothetical protein CNMCM7691_004063 [Aspergillus felis]